MRIIKQISEIRNLLADLSYMSIGFVPTMGYLHRGHEELVKKSVDENDITVVSVFVNPSQFGKGEDLGKYPRDIERDSNILEALGVDILFFPDENEIYPGNFKTYVDVEELAKVLCGKSRPGHFRGVATIVLKLVNIISPDVIYFGKKDAQQLIIIKKMIEDLNLNVRVSSIGIQRDTDGLALSSRNSYLSGEGRRSALIISRALQTARIDIEENGVRDPVLIRRKIHDMISEENEVTIDYIEIVSLEELKNVDRIDLNGTLIACAVFIENVRLIDNLILGEI